MTKIDWDVLLGAFDGVAADSDVSGLLSALSFGDGEVQLSSRTTGAREAFMRSLEAVPPTNGSLPFEAAHRVIGGGMRDRALEPVRAAVEAETATTSGVVERLVDTLRDGSNGSRDTLQSELHEPVGRLLAGLQAPALRSGLQGGVEPEVRFPAAVSADLAPAIVASRSQPQDEGSTAGTVLRTIGMVTGVGPVITGLLKLFGGGGSAGEPLYSPIPFSLPEQMSVESGLAQDRSFVDIGYAAQGGPRALGAMASPSRAPQIQIQVNAMDSRSFADHSEEIARAVREAMLRSHSLNDVIAEI